VGNRAPHAWQQGSVARRLAVGGRDELFLIAAVKDANGCALEVLRDWLEERGLPMWGVIVGEWYYIETPQFFFIGQVVEANAAGVKFAAQGEKIHKLDDLASFLATGKHARSDEYLPLPMPFTIEGLLISQSVVYDWPHGAPSGRRSHAPAE
jgi:hypothetical protein